MNVGREQRRMSITAQGPDMERLPEPWQEMYGVIKHLCWAMSSIEPAICRKLVGQSGVHRSSKMRRATENKYMDRYQIENTSNVCCSTAIESWPQYTHISGNEVIEEASRKMRLKRGNIQGFQV